MNEAIRAPGQWTALAGDPVLLVGGVLAGPMWVTVKLAQGSPGRASTSGGATSAR
jgi:hypothetical protein